MHTQLSIQYSTNEPKAKRNGQANPQTPDTSIFQCNSQLVLVGWRSKPCHDGHDAQNNEDNRNEHNQNGVLRRRRLFRWREKEHLIFVILIGTLSGVDDGSPLAGECFHGIDLASCKRTCREKVGRKLVVTKLSGQGCRLAWRPRKKWGGQSSFADQE
jgi:hypothetical protein